MIFVFNDVTNSLDIEQGIEVVILKKLDTVGKRSSCSCSSTKIRIIINSCIINTT